MIIKGLMLSLDVDGRFNLTVLDDDASLQQYVASMVCPQRPILTNTEMLASVQLAITELQCLMDNPKVYPEICKPCETVDTVAVQQFLNDTVHTSMWIDVDDENTYWIKCTLPTLMFDKHHPFGGRLNEDQVVAILKDVCSDVQFVKQGCYVATIMDKVIDVEIKSHSQHYNSAVVDMTVRDVVCGHYNVQSCNVMELMLRTDLAAIAE